MQCWDKFPDCVAFFVHHLCHIRMLNHVKGGRKNRKAVFKPCFNSLSSITDTCGGGVAF